MTAARRAATALLLAATAAGVGLLPAAPAAPAAAATGSAAAAGEVSRVPPNGVFTIVGHGWGHGHGMSQYGAYGAAKVRGLTYQQILAFYYPHADLVGQPLSTTVKVLLHDTSTEALPVVPRATGTLTAASSVTGVADCPLPASLDGGKTTVAGWRAKVVSTPDGTRLRLQATTDGNTWSRATLPDCDKAWSQPMDGSITFADGGVTKLARGGAAASYRGALRAAFTGSHIYVVNVVPMESYLLSVVPSEMPSSWSPAALEAQAVAARSYASYEIAHPKNRPYYDVYDDTRDQMYVGMSGEAASSTAAVKATQDPQTSSAMVLHDSSGHPAFTQFSSSDGGWTVAGGEPYLPARKDPYDGLVPSSVHTWTTTVSAATITSAFSSQIGSLRSIDVTGRDGNGQWGGRITTLTLTGSAGSVSLSGSTFRYDFGLRSEWFHVLMPPDPPTDVTATAAAGSATVAWQPPAAGSYARVTGYRVVLDPGGQSQSVPAGTTSVAFHGLTRGTAYTATVAATSKAGPGYPAQATTKVQRLSGADDIATAIAVSQASFADGKAGGVVLTRRVGSRDALAAGPLAAAHHAPLLLTLHDTLSPATQGEIQRVLPSGGTVYLVGGPGVVSDGVRASLQDLGYKVVRYAGTTPAGTAASIASAIAATTTVTSVFEVSADDYASAWAATPAAVRRHGVILLTDGTQQSPETASWLAHHATVTKRYAVGPAAAQADPAATPYAGADAAGTAVAVAKAFFSTPRNAAVAGTSRLVPGLLAAVRVGGSGPVLFPAGDRMPAAARSYLAGVRSALARVDLVGAGLPYDRVESDIQQALLG